LIIDVGVSYAFERTFGVIQDDLRLLIAGRVDCVGSIYT